MAVTITTMTTTRAPAKRNLTTTKTIESGEMIKGQGAGGSSNSVMVMMEGVHREGRRGEKGEGVTAWQVLT